MAFPSNFGYPPVTKSITNPNVKAQDALDRDFPMSFLTFIKTINNNFEPEALQNYYNNYIQLWNSKNSDKSVSSQTLIVEKYKEFLREISLNYTTLEEKKFLKKINFNDPYDLDVAIGFYSRKLKEISLHYNKRRENLKFELTRKKLKGTNFGIERSLKELIIQNVENYENADIFIDLEKFKRNIEIEIDEFYDIYPLYYNHEPNALYDNKDLDYGQDIFLRSNQDLINDIFAGVSEDIRELKEVDQLFDNKRKLTEKYISTDFYYISTGATTNEFLSGRIFEADKPSLNFANRNWPTTASTERTIFQSFRDKGFFKPSNTSIITVDGKNSSYYFNLGSLQPNTVYYFPDPKIIGNNGDVLTFIVDDSYLKNNFSTGNAVNQPTSTPNDTKYYGYHSLIDPNVRKYLDSLFELGYIHDSKRDIHNNLFGLFKKNNFQQGITREETDPILSLVLNGHTFYDSLYNEGYNFDYFIQDDTTFTETIRSGLSSNTNGFLGLSSYYTLFFRYFSPYDELISPTESILVPSYDILDGAFILNGNNVPYDDAMSSDLEAFPGNGSYYYNTLVEGGIHTSSPLQRALRDSLYPTLTADLTQSVRPDNVDTFYADGGYFDQPFNFNYSFISNDYSFINETNSPSVYQLSSFETDNIFSRYDLPGTIYIKNVKTKEVLPILESCPYMIFKYGLSAAQSLSAVEKFEISNDVIFIETANHLIIDKIGYSDGEFFDSKVKAYQFSLSGYQKFSNRFKVKNKVYYSIIDTLTNTITSNNVAVYPRIFEYDVLKNTNTLLFPQTLADINNNLSFFSLSGGSIRYESIDNPRLVYNSRNDIFNISFLAKDQNNLFYLHEYDFALDSPIRFLDHNRYKTNPYQVSNIFTPSYRTSLNVYLSSGSPTISAEEFIL